MINVGIIGSGRWALALSVILKDVKIIIKTRDLNKVKIFFKKKRQYNFY